MNSYPFAYDFYLHCSQLPPTVFASRCSLTKSSSTEAIGRPYGNITRDAHTKAEAVPAVQNAPQSPGTTE
jgi:hypothetical protein